LLLCLTVPSWAQNYPAFEAFGGFSILSLGAEGNEAIDLNREQFWGWQAGLAAHLHPNFALVGDFGGQYKHFEVEVPGGDDDDFFLHNHQFMLGPRVYGGSDRASGFAHFLVGGAHTGGSGLEGADFNGSTGLAFGVGGGVDLNVGEGGTAIRLVQLDWLPQRFAGDWTKDTFRLGIGLVFKGAR
jgi:hypothetical protein